MYHKILAGVDEDPRARDAAVLAESLAEACDADLLLVAAHQAPLLPFPLTVSREPHRAGDARAALVSVRPDCAPRAHTRTIPDVSPVRALRRCARDERADLLVVGSGGPPRAGRTRLGRTGKALMHDVHCAMAIAATGIADEDFALRRIVVGVDDRAEAHAALDVARELAAGAGAQLTVVAVVDDSVPVERTSFGMVSDLARWDEIIEARRAHLVHRLETVVGSDGPPVDIRVGLPATELADATQDADLLVLGARHRTLAERLSLGSTTEVLCSGAGVCSLLLVPAPAEA
jgi:nucleotide-binding universal stress UspA family protein